MKTPVPWIDEQWIDDMHVAPRDLLRAALWASDWHACNTANFSPPAVDMTEDYEFRYEQRGDEYALRSWHDGIEKSHRGLVADRPEWLAAILATAKVAGALPKIKEPPPEVILWFRTDKDNNLIEFIELK
jgi:hypothetical protein